MGFTRRGLLLGSAASALMIGASEARFPRGRSSVSSTNTDRVTLNLPKGGYANYFKAWLPRSSIGEEVSPSDVDGYPTGTISNNFAAEFAIAGDYYGQYTWAWTGTGGMQILGQAILVYSGGTFVGLGGSSGPVIGNPYFFGTNVAVVFKFGVLVSAVSGGSGSLVTITHANNGGIQTGTKVKFGVGCSANLSNGPNSDGSWTVTNVDATHITLNGSTGVTSPTVTGSGGINTQTEAVFNMPSLTPYYTTGQTYTGFTNIILCKTSNYTAVVGGAIYDPVYIAQLQELSGRPGGVGRSGDFWLRLMDIIGGQFNFEDNFANRLTLSSQSYENHSARPKAFAAGSITRSSGDLYTCASNPSGSPASGPPIDNEIIQGVPDAICTGLTPTLTNPRSGFGTWPIVYNVPLYFTFSGPPASAGLTLQWTFSAAWLNGGTPYVYSYKTQAQASFTGSAFGSTLTVTGVSGTIVPGSQYLKIGGVPQLKIISQLTGTAGGNGTYQLENTTSFGATSCTAQGYWGDDAADVGIFKANLQIAMAGDPTFANKIRIENSGNVQLYPLTPLAGALTISSVPAICTVSTLAIYSGSGPGIQASVPGTFIFSKLLGAFIYAAGGIVLAPPLEAIASLCNAVNASVWWTWPVNTKSTYIQDLATFFAGNLNAGLKFGGEYTNEIWNSSANPFAFANAFSYSLGLFDGGGFNITAIRTKQYGDLSLAAWVAAGRSASDHHVFSMGQMVGSGIDSGFNNYQLKGTLLDASTNTTFGSYGGLEGTSQTSMNASPNRPIDTTTAIGFAPYWTSPWWISYSANIYGTVSDNSPWLQAAKDYEAGSTTTGIVAIINQLSSIVTRPTPQNGNYLNFFDFGDRGIGFIMQQFEAIAASYDSLRTGRGQAKVAIFHYEGGPQWAQGEDFNAGVNEVNTANVTALANKMTSLGWDVSAYTTSGTDNKTEMATMVMNLTMAVKYSSQYKDMIKTYYYAQLKSISGGNREVHAGQYGYNRSAWGFFPNNYSQGNAFTNYNAFAEYNL